MRYWICHYILYGKSLRKTGFNASRAIKYRVFLKDKTDDIKRI